MSGGFTNKTLELELNSIIHQNGIIHRDLKPSNILVGAAATGTASTQSASSANGSAVKILDFGLARFTGPDSASPALTEAGLVQGSLPFMSRSRRVANRAASTRAPISIRSASFSIG